ncbi:MAG: hypothetical protein A2087_11880 [Spirochaetes bacterium GWD1_61_31]|nr:MAG: hypothetical protein A2Y37_07000 [Spirochaetes bacterium GWB1_60_80]OHD30820.1 MAG: hypothetical protein A2004_04525 [Spirochaetes bacterium GWC1_61_12]OHD37371.1 MAG: hypothetical protein A2087_11880 [Spirochaetes bacterium GWD1_61_31]OHD46320.1 MAG: hypothetical protein A2Y35_07275 [Spirochaetes bacterium GWE1_60_18]OHD60927.1 MAG: hypothetical protein A2Y32_12020 [Spirochaetes bacterium GWF1_60_12]HAP42815.1 radical SAM protein [Spirochaetaceae bacterium]
MDTLIIQVPFTQLNTAYPAIWYLDAFLRREGLRCQARDTAIACFRAIFSSTGLPRIFERARQFVPQLKGDQVTARRLAAYFSQEAAYCRLIDGLCAYLAGEDPAFAYRLAVGADLPLGMRAEAVLEPAGGISVEEAPALATAILNDLADFVRYTVDPNFETVRYANSLPASVQHFADLVAVAEGSWLLAEFYRPILATIFDAAAANGGASATDGAPVDQPLLIGLSVPFPGCLAGAVVAAQAARAHFGDRATILLGGAYVSTELRECLDPALFNLFDYVCYDAGYADLAILARQTAPVPGLAPPGLSQTRWLDRATGRIAGAADAPPPAAVLPPEAASPAASNAARAGAADVEHAAIALVHPDYHGADFRQYLRIVDSPNPMHRLWNDTPWLKYRLAHGCYWQRCAFCDTQLHYIRHYQPVKLDSLLAAMDEAAARHRLYGIHFVDEAMPPALVRDFAARNRQRTRPFTFWGNARFDKSWTESLCAEAAAGGLIAVSGGIEIATTAGLEVIDKGFSLVQLVRSLANFKAAGILVHAYLIYGFPGQDHQDIADSAEMVRQLLAEGLIDSAFWHRFVLTRHSRLYADWQRGLVPSLEPLPPPGSFAINDLRFQGEAQYEVWTQVLDSALAAWADRGETTLPLPQFYGAAASRLPRPRLNARQLLRQAGVSQG